MSEFLLVPCDKEFRFKKCCPYCGEDVEAHFEGWEQEDDGTWTGTNLYVECVTSPGEESPDFDDWLDAHTYMPYVNWLPVQQKLEKQINSKYRFIL